MAYSMSSALHVSSYQVLDSSRLIHYWDGVGFIVGHRDRPLCRDGRWSQASTNWDEVTCKKCRKLQEVNK